MTHRSADHPMMAAIAWRPDEPAERVHDHILFSRGTSNSYVVLGDDGDLVINAGMTNEGQRHRERFEALAGRRLDVRAIVLTQSHPDHVGGWHAFADPSATTYVQRGFPRLWAERKRTAPFFMPRNARVLHALMPAPAQLRAMLAETREPTGFAFVSDRLTFSLSGRRYELINAPSGETLDSLLVWIPEEKTLFTGNFMGALYGALPNFYTLRGDRARSVSRFLVDLDAILALEPELLITGHDAPIEGGDRIAGDLAKLRLAVQHIHDETLAGMNAGKDLNMLMRDIALPAELKMAPGRGPVSWYVRAVWEEYSGWFMHRSTTELYAIPPRAIWAELVEAAGGPDALAARAAVHAAAGRPVEALHFTDIVLDGDPAHRGAREAQRAALEILLERSNGEAFDEIGWLESEVAAADAALVSRA